MAGGPPAAAGDLSSDDAARAFRRLFECSPISIGLLTLDAHVFAVNPAGASLWGLPAEALRGRAITDLTHPDDVAALSEQFGDLAKGRHEGYEAERRLRRADGKTVVVHSSVGLVRGEHREPLFVVAVWTPSGDAKLAAARTETRSTAHDLNNLLMAVVGRSELLLREELPKEGATQAEHILDAAYRAAALVRRLLSIPPEAAVGPVDVNELILGMHGVMTQLVGSGDQIVLTLDPSSPRAVVDREGLERALGNLAGNARDAMPHGGTVTIGTRVVGTNVEIRFSDTGTGVPSELRERIFERDFSTKPEGLGHGIGLANVRAFVDAASGTIDVESPPGAGTTFTIALPRAPA